MHIQESIEYYKERAKAINARPIKKVAEAKARKKKKILRRLERARKKAEGVIAEEDVTNQEKAQQVKQSVFSSFVCGGLPYINELLQNLQESRSTS